jgi:hypothetical protein
MNDDVELWKNMEASLLSMSDDEFLIAFRELQELVSLAICDKFDAMESSVDAISTDVQSILKKF